MFFGGDAVVLQRVIVRVALLGAAITLLRSGAGAQPTAIAEMGGTLRPGPLDLITDVPGVRVGQVTKISGNGPLVPGVGPVRTGVTVVVPDDDIWNDRVAAATYDLNGNGELSGAHWVDEAGFLEVPIALTNTLNVARVDDGVLDWLIARHPQIGIRDDVPLPVVAECDDQGLNDIQGRHVSPRDTVAALDAARGGTFARGDVGAGTGMRGFGFKAGIGSASRVTPAVPGAKRFTVGVLVNLNTGSREELRIAGAPIGRELQNVDTPIFPGHAYQPSKGRAADGSIIIVIATDAPLDYRQLRELGKRARARPRANGRDFARFQRRSFHRLQHDAPVSARPVAHATGGPRARRRHDGRSFFGDRRSDRSRNRRRTVLRQDDDGAERHHILCDSARPRARVARRASRARAVMRRSYDADAKTFA